MTTMTEQKEANGCQIAGVSHRPKGLDVAWFDGSNSFFHYVWLRDCCHCEACGDRNSGKRSLMPCDIPLDIEPLAVETDDGALKIEWAPDGHLSYYDPVWLQDHRYDDEARTARRRKPVLWDSVLSEELPEEEYGIVCKDPFRLLDLCCKLLDYGFVLIRKGPKDPGSIEKVANLFGELEGATYGKIFDLTPAGQIRTLGSAVRPVPPHTDEPYGNSPPGIGLIGCVRRASDGGDTLLVDGFALAERMRRDDPEGFRLLSSRPHSFVRIHPGSKDLRTRLRTFVLDEFGEVCGVRINAHSSGPIDLPAEEIEPYFAAHHRLTQLMMSPDYQIRLPLEAGEFVIFDNHRVLHARTHFADPNRFLQVCNVPRGQFQERFRLLAKQLGRSAVANMILPPGTA